MPALYQKYRPRNFAEVVDQNHVKITLQSELETDSIAHAYLFAGPRGTGKTTMARVFAKALNCERRAAGQFEPCGVCDSCERISRGASLDIIEIDAASHTGVDNVRENIIANARVAASGNRYKVFVIDEVHMLSTSAFNALLKTLEEPPRNTVFILATTEAHKLPTTIISRCQRFDFKRISHADIIQKLNYIAGKEEVIVADEVLAAVARASDGHMRDAESILGQVFAIGGRSITAEHAALVIHRGNIMAAADFIVLIANKDTPGAVRLVNQLVDEGVDLRQFTADTVESARRLLLAKVHVSLAESFAHDCGQAVEEKLMPIIEAASMEWLAKLTRAFMQAQQELKTAGIAQLPLELAVIRLTGAPPEAQHDRMPTGRPDAVAAAAPAAVKRPLSDIQEKWNEVLASIKKYNHSLSFILRACELRPLVDTAGQDGGGVCLAFKYKFHQDRLSQPSVANIMQSVFTEVYGAPLFFNTVLDEQLALEGMNVSVAAVPPDAAASTSSPNVQSDVDTILKMFGGKVVG